MLASAFFMPFFSRAGRGGTTTQPVRSQPIATRRP